MRKTWFLIIFLYFIILGSQVLPCLHQVELINFELAPLDSVFTILNFTINLLNFYFMSLLFQAAAVVH